MTSHSPPPRFWLIRFLLIVCCCLGQGVAYAQELENAADDDEPEEVRVIDADDDDTADIDTESSVDYDDYDRGLNLSGDFRPLVDYFDIENRDGSADSDNAFRARLRIKAVIGVADSMQIGVRAAGLCTSADCSPEWILDTAIPAANGLAGGQISLDEAYLHIFRRERINFTLGRLQTRFVLRGGVFARSLDRNDSNNTNVTWTDGAHVKYQWSGGWMTHFIIQRNASDGSGSIRRGPLDFDDIAARNTFFVGFENTNALGPVVQRSLDISYLPSSLLKDGTTSGPREDYWAIVARVAARWPLGSSGTRLRAGVELGYAPETPSSLGAGINADVDGLAWNVVVSLMDFKPSHNIGINYGRTGAGWLLSPQFAQNEELFEIRYQWRNDRFPALDVRVRWREEIEIQSTAMQKRRVFDAFARLTWLFGQ